MPRTLPTLRSLHRDGRRRRRGMVADFFVPVSGALRASGDATLHGCCTAFADPCRARHRRLSSSAWWHARFSREGEARLADG